MQFLGYFIKTGIRLGATRPEPWRSPVAQQQKTLKRLLNEAADTAFGQQYNFQKILSASDLVRAFQERVPMHNYDAMYDKWWSRAQQDEPDVCWPGLVPWFAVSSGTSNAATKYIPVTPDIIRSMKKVSRRLFCDMAHFNLPADLFTKQMLMVGSCTNLNPEGNHWVGDMSGIIGLNRPFWLKKYYKPDREITTIPEWSDRIERIAEEAPGWDIGFIVGNVAWVQLIFERILEKYQLKHIHEIWPNFSLLVHGGIFFEPYRQTFEQLLGQPVHYVDSYMASEGFIAYQPGPQSRLLRLITDAGIFYEFVPFNEQHFDENGELYPDAKAVSLKDVIPGQQYALLMSTDAGAWRYLLGDTIQFEDVNQATFKVTGRVKHYLSVVGEHLSVDNMNVAIQRTDQKLQAGVKEFAVAAVQNGSHWAHQWYVSTDNPNLKADEFAAELDAQLMEINDDYRVERRYALREIRVQLLPHGTFYSWMESQGKLNGQAKVPRVLKGAVQTSWEQFLNSAVKHSTS
ncbi:MAG: GH3 auxin-responsive promoter family protein [Lewinellaceae bacterium]|nr:GH3 auxin-responsive promoter family protein [Saprospiraceae bacterium]MCB9331032.1 GH3 auxin-responsive promoter family protein [Lewinellaceae bacterium]